jgi:hypothetical protein
VKRRIIVLAAVAAAALSGVMPAWADPAPIDPVIASTSASAFYKLGDLRSATQPCAPAGNSVSGGSLWGIGCTEMPAGWSQDVAPTGEQGDAGAVYCSVANPPGSCGFLMPVPALSGDGSFAASVWFQVRPGIGSSFRSLLAKGAGGDQGVYVNTQDGWAHVCFGDHGQNLNYCVEHPTSGLGWVQLMLVYDGTAHTLSYYLRGELAHRFESVQPTAPSSDWPNSSGSNGNHCYGTGTPACVQDPSSMAFAGWTHAEGCGCEAWGVGLWVGAAAKNLEVNNGAAIKSLSSSSSQAEFKCEHTDGGGCTPAPGASGGGTACSTGALSGQGKFQVCYVDLETCVVPSTLHVESFFGLPSMDFPNPLELAPWAVCEIGNVLRRAQNAVLFAVNVILDLIVPSTDASVTAAKDLWADVQGHVPFSYVAGGLAVLPHLLDPPAESASITVKISAPTPRSVPNACTSSGNAALCPVEGFFSAFGISEGAARTGMLGGLVVVCVLATYNKIMEEVRGAVE